MKRTRRDPSTPHDLHESPPRPHIALQSLPDLGDQMHGQGMTDKAKAPGELASHLPAEASIPQPTEARSPETADRCPCIRAYSVSLVRLPGGALRVAFFKGDDVKPRRMQDRQQ